MKAATFIVILAASSLTACAQMPEQAAPPSQMGQMQSHMQSMHALMEQVRASDDEVERHRLMQEHMHSMRQGMAMMEGMPMPEGAMGQHMGMMRQMMGQMMQHMMQHHAEDGGSADGAAAEATPSTQSPFPSTEGHEQGH